MNYYSGYIQKKECNYKINHGALLVGFSASGPKYWIVKNSWGLNWGTLGYINLEMKNTCGICKDALFPIFNTNPDF